MTGAEIAFGDCYCCHNRFAFDPVTVESVEIDPVTRLLPDVDPDTAEPLPEPRQVDNLVKAPICPTCVDAVNARREAAGLPILWHRLTPTVPTSQSDP